MILYNVTINIDDAVVDSWLLFMKEKHISDVLRTGLFIKCNLCKIHAEEHGGKSFSIQYFLKSWDDYNNYQNNYSDKLQKEHSEKFQGKFVAFRTVLQVIHEQQA